MFVFFLSATVKIYKITTCKLRTINEFVSYYVRIQCRINSNELGKKLIILFLFR